LRWATRNRHPDVFKCKRGRERERERESHPDVYGLSLGVV
jgi:hypothetical protein